jgi:hypothetical protein
MPWPCDQAEPKPSAPSASWQARRTGSVSSRTAGGCLIPASSAKAATAAASPDGQLVLAGVGLDRSQHGQALQHGARAERICRGRGDGPLGQFGG